MSVFFVIFGRFFQSLLLARLNYHEVGVNLNSEQKRSKLGFATFVARLFVVASLLMASSYAQAGTVSGTVWNDLNADTFIGEAPGGALGDNILTQQGLPNNNAPNTYGDPEVAGAGFENGYEGIDVCVRGTITLSPVPTPPASPTATYSGDDLCATTDANGDYSFDLPQGTGSANLRVRFAIPATAGFDFTSPTPINDTDVTANPPPSNSNDPQTGLINISSYDGSDITDGLDAGLSPTAVIVMNRFDTNPTRVGVQDVLTGTPDYNIYGGCANTDAEDPTNNQDPDPGDDCAKYDDYIRSNDLLTSYVELKVDNADADGVDNVIVEYQWTPVGGAALALQGDTSEGLPTTCLTGNDGNGVPYNPQSNVSEDPATGTLKLICNAGNLASGDILSLPVSIKVTGPDGASVDTEMKAYAQANDAVPSQELEGPSIEVSAAPRFDLTKNSGSATSPPNVATTSNAVRYEFNEVTGQQEPGYLVWYDVSIVADPASDGKGIAALDGSVEFKEFIDPTMAVNGAKIICDYTSTNSPGSTGYFGSPTSGSLPYGDYSSLGDGPPYRDDAVANAGITNCTSPTNPATGETGYTITGMDSSGLHIPSCGRATLANCSSTDPWSYVYTGRMPVWYPFSALFKSTDPTWNGDVNNPDDYINGVYPVENCVGGFDPNTEPDANGAQVSNYGDDFEPGWVLNTATGEYEPEGNNCRTLSLNVQVGNGITSNKFYCDNLATPGLTNYTGCNDTTNFRRLDGASGNGTGDGIITADKFFFANLYITNNDFFNVLDEPWLCDAIDNSTYTFAPWTGNTSVGEYDHVTFIDREPFVPTSVQTTETYIMAEENGWLVEYARFTTASGRKTWQINHDTSGTGTPRADNTLPISNPQQQAAALDCGIALTDSGDLEWATNPETNGWSVDDLVMVRVRPDPAWEAANGQRTVLTGQEDLYGHFRFQARDTFWEPDSLDGEHGLPIPTGTIIPNQSQHQVEGFPLSTDPNDPPANFGSASYDPDTHMGINTTNVTKGDRAIYTGIIVTVDKKAFDINVGETAGDDGLQEEFAGEQVNWTLEPQVISESSFGTPTATNIIITDVLPNYTTYNSSCSDTPAFYSGPSVAFNTPNAGETTLTWTAGDVAVGTDMPTITVCTDTDQLAPAPVDVTNDVVITADNVPYAETFQHDRRTVRLLQTARFAVQKAVDQSFDFQDQDQVWTMTWKNTSENVTFAPPDVIDVLPYNGDAIDGAPGQRETFASSYSGTLGLASWPPAAPVVTLADGSTRTDSGAWYLTGVDPTGGLSVLDPDAKNTALNGTPFDPATNTPADLSTGSTPWCTNVGVTAENGGACPATLADVTAIRWVSTDYLSPADTAVTQFTAIADGNRPNDFYINRFTGSVENFSESVRSNEPFVQVVGFSLGDLIWLDLNGDGIYNPGTDLTAPAGVTVNLFNADGSPATDLNGNSSTTTDANGRWLFEGMAGDTAVSNGTYLAGEFYVTVTGLPTGWTVDGTSSTFEADPNTDSNETADHHTLLDMGTIRSSGIITLSATVANGLITGDEPTGDNVAVLGNPLVQDAFTNFTLDLMLVPLRGDIRIVKDVVGGGPDEGWEFTVTPVDPAGCPLPNTGVSPTFTNPTTTDSSGEALFVDLLVNNISTGAVCQYNVAETAISGWTQTAVSPTGPYSVDEDNVLRVEFTNTRDIGNIEVTKTVNGADAPAGWEFTLTSLVAGCDIPATVTNPATTADGSGGTVTFTGVPTHSATPQFAQCTYQVAETAQTGWTQQTAAGDLTGLTVTAGQTTDVAVVNNANPLQAQVAKSVTGVASTFAWEFGFSLTTTGAIDPTLTSTDALSSGTGSSTSTDLVTWGNIQPGQTYVLSEMLIDGYVAGTMSCTGVTDIDSAADTVTFVAPTTTDLNTATFEISCAISNAASPVQAQVTKTVSGVDANLDWSFGFSLAPAATLTSPDLIVAGTGSTTSTDVVSWGGLIPGTRYVLTETVTAGYEVTTDLQCANLTDLDTDPNTVTFDAPLGDTSTTTVDVSCTITNTAYGSDLQVTKTVSTNDTADWMFEFTLTPNATVVAASPAVGNGSGTAVVSWSDLVPGTEYVLAETPTTGYTAGSMVCTGVTDTDGDTGNASVTFIAPIGDANDPTTTFEVECAITNQQWPDLVVSKAVTPEEVAANGTLTYTITAQNDGILPATAVVLSDVLPNDLEYVSDTPSQGSYDSSTGEWDVGTIVGGASSTLTIVATFEPEAGVCSATATNTVTVSEQGEVDFDTSNHSDSAAVSLVSLALTKQLSAASPVDLGNGSQQVTYEFTLVNNGAQDLSSLQINENLAAMIDNPNDNDAVFVVTRVVSPDATLTPNASFDGADNLAVLSGSDTLVAGATGSINVELELTPDTYFGPFVNSASASGETANGTMVTDLSENNASPTTSPCVYDEPTPLTLSTPSTPITLGWFKSENVGASVVFNWETELEVSNAGFIISAQGDDGQWVELTTPMLASQGDSVKPQNYQHEVVGVSSRVFRITDVSNTGKLKHHGPFELGKEYGVQSERKATDWQRIQQEQERREQQRLEQLKDDLQKRLQSSRSGNNWLSGAFAAVMGVLVPAAHAADLLNFEIEEAGIYRVSDSELRAIGLDLRGIDLARIGLEVDNTLAPVNIVTGSQSSTFTTGSYIEFPAKGKKTLYTGVNRYTLTLDEGQLPIATNDVAVPFKGAATSYLAEASYAEQNRYTQLSPSESDSWYADRLSAIQGSAEKTIGLTLDNQANALSTPQSGLIGQSQVGAQEGQGVRHKPSLDLELWGASALPGNGVDNPDHHVVVALNGVEVINERFDGVRVKTINQPLADIGQGTNLVKITLPNEHGYPFDMVNIDRVSLLYPRRFVAQDEGQSLVFESSWDKFRVRGLANSEVIVYRLSQQGRGQVMTSRGVEAVDQSSCTNADGCMVVFAGVADGDDADYFVSTQAGVKSPTISIAPAGEALFAGGAEVLIVAHPDFIQTSSGALEGYAYDLLASYSSVDIVSTDSIYAEYSGHVMDAEAIARYVADAYAQRGTRHLIIVGGDVYDYHNNLNSGAKSFVPSKYVQIAQNINSVPSDSSYADVDGDFVPDMTVTRLPVRTEAELNTLLDKRQDFLNRSYQNTAVFAADADDSSSYSFDADAESIAAMLGSQWQIDRAYVESDGLVGAKQSIVDGINSGASITSFFGHSSMDRWSVDGVFNGADAASLLNSGKPTVVTQWGCWNTFHVSPTEDSMAHRLLVEGDQGAVVVMGASSLTKADAEKRMAELLFTRLMSGMRIADAVLSAKQALAQERPYQLDVLLGWAILGPADMTVN